MTSSSPSSINPSEDGGLEITVTCGSEVERVSLPIVKAQPQHRSYILSTWVRSAVGTARKLMGVSAALAAKEEGRLSEALWENSWVISSPRDAFVINGYICFVKDRNGSCIVHYAYIPPELRMKGIYSALTKYFCGPTYQYVRPWPFREGVPNGGSYNPYIIGSS